MARTPPSSVSAGRRAERVGAVVREFCDVSDVSKYAVEWPRHLGEIQCGDQEGRGLDLPASVRAEEATELFLGRPLSPLGLLLEGAERRQLTSSGDDLLHCGGSEGTDQLVLQVLDTHVEAESFHVGAIEAGAQPGSLETQPEVAL